jgi:hypothetical protein
MRSLMNTEIEPEKQQEKMMALEVAPLNAIEAVERAQIDMQIATARRYPRALAQVKADMLEQATLDAETAGACFYSLPRGGKNIEGPSIRLAEIALSCYGNVKSGSRVIEVIAEGAHPFVTIQAVCHDLQRNVAVSIEKRRRIVAKKGPGDTRRPLDEDDINLATNAASAIALRDAIFKIVPGALVRPVFEAARRVAVGDQKTLSERRLKALRSFTKMGIPAERVLAGIGRRSAEEITLEDLEQLLGIFNAIKDGALSIDNAFPSPAAAAAQEKRAERKVPKPDFDAAQAAAAPPKDEGRQTARAQQAPARDEMQPQLIPDEPPQSPPPPAAAAAAEKKARRPAPASSSAAADKTAKDILFQQLKSDTTRANFLEGLKLIEFPGVPADAEIIHELTDAAAQAILDEGIDEIFERIRDERWKKNMQ